MCCPSQGRILSTVHYITVQYKTAQCNAMQQRGSRRRKGGNASISFIGSTYPIANHIFQSGGVYGYRYDTGGNASISFYWFRIPYCQSHLPVRRSVWIPVRHTCRRCSTCRRNNKFIYSPPTVDIRIVSIYKNFKIIFNEWKKCKV